MKSKRLTIEMKGALVDHILFIAFAKEKESIRKSSIQFANECYDYRYNPTQQNNMFVFPDAKRVFMWDSTITCTFNGRYAHDMEMGKERPFWNNELESLYRFDAEHSLTIKWNTMQKDKEAFNNRRRAMGTEIRSIINSITTTKKLLEVWPECKQWVAELGWLQEPAPVPMKNPDKLNALLCDIIGKQSPTCTD